MTSNKNSSIGEAYASVQVSQALITAAIIHRMFREELTKIRVHVIEAIQGKIIPYNHVSIRHLYRVNKALTFIEMCASAGSCS
jgi:hypothetical protein